MTEEHKNRIAEMVMNDYDIRPSLAHRIVDVFVANAERIIKEDNELIRKEKE